MSQSAMGATVTNDEAATADAFGLSDRELELIRAFRGQSSVSAEQDAAITAHPSVSDQQDAAHSERKPAAELTQDERAELEHFRAEKARQAAAALEPKEPVPYLWLHLANGKVIESTGHMTHYKGVPVVAAYPITEMES